MLDSIKKAIVNYYILTEDVSARDAMSMTLHDCIRLIEREKQSKGHPTGTRLQAYGDKGDGESCWRTAAKLESPALGF